MRLVAVSNGFSCVCAVVAISVFSVVGLTCAEDLHLIPLSQGEAAPIQRLPVRAGPPPPLKAEAEGPSGCSAWQWANPLPQGNGLSSVAFGADRFVASGRKGTILTSSNGAEWVVQPAKTSRTIESVTWVGTQFMAAVSDESGQVAGVVLTSRDGTTWAERSTGTTTRINGFATNGSIIVAVGWTGHVLTTTDGVTWTARTSGTTNGLLDVTWAGSEFVAVGVHGTVAKSPDGITWTAYQLAVDSLAIDVDLSGVSWSGSVLVMVTRTHAWGIFSSSDREHFTSTKSGYFGVVAWGGGRFVAAGVEIWTSTDGVVWTEGSVEDEHSDFNAVAWGAATFVATAYWKLMTSSDGTNWSSASSSATESYRNSIATIHDMAFSSSTYVAVGMCGVTITSHDGGATWQGPSAPPPSCGVARDLYGVAAGPTGFVAVGTHGTVRTSADGVDWAETTSGTTSDLSAVEWTGARFAAVGDSGTIVTSLDGSSWSRATSATTSDLFDLATNGHRVVAVGRSTIVSSEDGLQWTDRSPGTAALLLGVAWSGERFVAVGSNVVLTSEDGITWTEQPNGASYKLSGVTAGDGRLLAVGYKLILTGTDGVSWQELDYPSYYGFFAQAAWDGSSFFIGGDGGLIFRSVCSGESEALYIPASAHLAGAAGSNWRTDLDLYNPGEPAVTVTLELLRRDKENTSPQSVSAALGPQASARFEDVLQEKFGFSGAAALRISSSTADLLATSRTYNDTPAGTYGQFVPGISSQSAVAAGSEARLTGLRQTPGTGIGARTNIGVVNTTAIPVTVTADLFSAQGASLGSVRIDLRAYEYRQVDRIYERVTSQTIDGGYAVLRTATSGGRFLAYATVIDNQTNDPVFVPGCSTRSTDEIYVAAGAHAAGAAGAVWRTDLFVHNPGTTLADYTIESLRRDQANSDPATATFSLAPGLAATYPDVLWQQFAFNGAASLRVTPSSGSLMVTSRTYNQAPTGTFGQFAPGQPIAEAVSAGHEGRLIGLSHNPGLASGFRTNIGFVNASGVSVVVDVALHDSTGTLLGTKEWTLAPYEFKQIDRIYKQVTGEAVIGGYAVISTQTAGGRFFAYASVIDNRTGDPVCVRASLAP